MFTNHADINSSLGKEFGGCPANVAFGHISNEKYKKKLLNSYPFMQMQYHLACALQATFILASPKFLAPAVVTQTLESVSVL